jgi:glutaminase
LSASGEERAKERQARSVSLAALLGEYEPIAGHGHYWARAPRLRQQIQIAKISDEAAKAENDNEPFSIETASKIAALAVFVEENGKTRPATYDEVLDEFTAVDIAEILQRYMGMGVPTDPNAGTQGNPTGAESSAT